MHCASEHCEVLTLGGMVASFVAVTVKSTVNYTACVCTALQVLNRLFCTHTVFLK